MSFGKNNFIFDRLADKILRMETVPYLVKLI
jgi:hypothetical protein